MKNLLIAAVAGLNILAQLTVLGYGLSARLSVPAIASRTAAGQ